MECLLEHFTIGTVLLDVLESLEENLFDLAEVIDLDALDTYSEGRLSRSVIKSSSRTELWCNLTLNDAFVEWSVRSLHQQRRQYLQAECLV